LGNGSNRFCQKFPKIKERENLISDQAITIEKLFKQARANFRFNKILIMNAHALNDLTHMESKKT
jgi:hypothetical protein